ncbi:MAG: T9SS type A sorting domain-containing protein [Bacteroidia bacterium]|nr:T9SS type A sorting domain-containing protein [Bacteroidia bacterium]
MRNIILSLQLIFMLTVSMNVYSDTDTTKVLFIGSDLIMYNNLPDIFKGLSVTAGKIVFIDQAVHTGFTFANHVTDSTTIAKINQTDWDFVILQEQSQTPSYDSTRDSLMYPYAIILDSMIKANHACTRPVFLMTWGNKKGDVDILAQGGSDTYVAMQHRIRVGYMTIADSLGDMVAPAGVAWRTTIIQDTSYIMYQADNINPSIFGSYLAACAIYSTIYDEQVFGNTYYSGLMDLDAANLQQIASHTVLDTISYWNIGTWAKFSYYSDQLNVYFENKSCNATSFTWNFGDLSVLSTEENPVHSYAAPGIYIISLAVADSCTGQTDTMIIHISVTSLGMNDLTKNTGISIFPNPAGNLITVKFSGDPAEKDIQILDAVTGRLLKEYPGINQDEQTLDISNLATGVYILKVYCGESAHIGKFIKMDER